MTSLSLSALLTLICSREDRENNNKSRISPLQVLPIDLNDHLNGRPDEDLTLRLSVPTQNMPIGRVEFKLYVQVSNKV